MDKFLVVFKREYVERVRTRAFIMTTLLVPVFITAVMLLPAILATRSRPSANARNVMILDATGAGLGDLVSANLMADSTLGPVGQRPRVRVIAPERVAPLEAEVVKTVQDNAGPVGYLVLNDSTMSGLAARYAGRNATSPMDVDKVRTAVRQAVIMARLRTAGVDTATVRQMSRMNLRMSAERITASGRGGSGQTGFIVGFMIAFLLYLSIILHGQNVLRGVLEEKTNRVAEVVLSSVKPDVLLAGKVAGVGAVGLTQQVLWLAGSAYLTQMIAPVLLKNTPAMTTGAAQAGAVSAFGGLTIGIFAATLVFFLIGFLFYASLFAAAGSAVNSEQEAQQMVFPVMLPLIASMVVMQPVLMSPNSALAVTMSWLPFSSPLIMPMRMIITPVSPLEVAGSAIVGLLGSFAVIWVAARIYRVGMLMYGKRPTLGELVRWIRVAG